MTYDQWKRELADEAKETGFKGTTTEAGVMTEMIFEKVASDLMSGEEVSIPHFGKFKVVDKSATTKINPQTGKPIDVPAKRVVKFLPAKALKEAVNK